ncbi:Transposase [Legionella anisa]|uniref:Transposase n=1 Tax=Legionella anisa TaxID=28082 RepID=A0AAX0WW74_9GAMM|nr:hypothetical protein DLD14_06210 [Legionella anisa]KTC73728.1 hypothetical protein Lani_0819 [Legionella anisa]PNL62623.1 hypothetical protein A6J39_016185 [Legionella anisa]
MHKNNPEQKSNRKKYSPHFKDQALERAKKDGIARSAPKFFAVIETMFGIKLSEQKYSFLIRICYFVLKLSIIDHIDDKYAKIFALKSKSYR